MVHVVRDVTGRDADARQLVAREELREGFRRFGGRLDEKFDHMNEMFDAKLSILAMGLRGEMATLGAGLRGEIATLGANHQGDMKELRSDMSAVEHRLTGEFRRLVIRQTGWMIGTMLVFMGVFTGVLFATARFFAMSMSGSP